MSTEFRLARPDDASGIVEIYTPYCESTHVSFETTAPTVDEMRYRIAKVTQQYPWLVAESNGQITGYVYASRHRERAAYRWTVDVAVYIAPEFQRRNLGRALYTTLFSILQLQGYFRALAGVTLPNPGSVGLHEAVGFRPIAVYKGVGFKLGRWLDVGWWQLDLQPEVNPPPEPVPMCQMLDDPAVRNALATGQKMLRPK